MYVYDDVGALRAQSTNISCISYRLGLSADFFDRACLEKEDIYCSRASFGKSLDGLHFAGSGATPPPKKKMFTSSGRDGQEPRHRRSVESSSSSIIYWVMDGAGLLSLNMTDRLWTHEFPRTIFAVEKPSREPQT